jgi:hypothetical protein
LNRSLLSADEYDDGEDSNNNKDTFEDPCPPLAGFEFPRFQGSSSSNNNIINNKSNAYDDESSVATEDMASGRSKLSNVPAVAWVLALLSRLLWLLLVLQVLLELPFTLLRWASIPSSDRVWDAKRRVVAVVSPTGFVLALLLDAQGWEGFYASNDLGVGAPLYQVVLGCGAVCSLLVFWLTVGSLDPLLGDNQDSDLRASHSSSAGVLMSNSESDASGGRGVGEEDNNDDDSLPSVQLETPGSGGGGWGNGGGGGPVLPLPRIYPVLAIFAFASSVVWMDLIANEAVALMEAIGVALGVSTAILGLTVLAVGNRCEVSLNMFGKETLGTLVSLSTTTPSSIATPPQSSRRHQQHQ